VRFLLSRRWILFAVAVGLLAYGCWWLGEWQFHRLDERQQRNAHVERNIRLDPVPVDDVLAPGDPVAADEEWRRVSAEGTYLDDETLLLRYQTRDGASGVDVVTPLRVEGSGALLLVDRGWLATDNAGSSSLDTPPPPSGTVRVVGWARADATGDSTQVTDRSTRAISSKAIGDTLDGERLYGGFLDLQSETPPPSEPLTRTELPDLGSGPHFFYGLQWWFFAALAVFGFGYLAFDERRRLRRSAEAPEREHEEAAGAAPS
jgi:cytochrome oxidase assembly protein ShyY1